MHAQNAALREKKNHMNHIFDADPQDPNSEDEGQDSTQLKFLKTLIDKLIKRLEEDSYKPRVQDALKAIQLQQKVAKTSEAEKFFWQEIENIRNEELPKLYPEPTSLQVQIQETILGLKDRVKNGILPLKTITDAFNQARSEQGRLTYHRMAPLLSAMGFTKAKTRNGCSAIIWDDQLLPQHTSSHTQNPESDEISGSGSPDVLRPSRGPARAMPPEEGEPPDDLLMYTIPSG